MDELSSSDADKTSVTKGQMPVLVMGGVALPRDIFYSMFSHFTPRMISSFALANPQFMWILQDNDFWKEKFKIHFPEYFDEAAALNPASWLAAYIQRENQEYKDLTPEEKHLLAVLKERDMDDVIDDVKNDDKEKYHPTLILPPDPDNLPGRPDNHSFIYVANKYKRQKFLNYYYRGRVKAAEEKATTSMATTQKNTLLHEAVACCQPTEILAALTSNDPTLFAKKANANGDTALNIAAWVGNIAAAKWLIENEPAGIDHKDKKNAGPFESAIYAGQLQFIKFLKTTNYYKPQHNLRYASMALFYGHPDISLCFIGEKYKNVINYKCRINESETINFFMAAVQKGFWDIVKCFIEKTPEEVFKIIFSSDFSHPQNFFSSIMNADRSDVLKLLIEKTSDQKVVSSISAGILNDIFLHLEKNPDSACVKYFIPIILEHSDFLEIDTERNDYLKALTTLFRMKEFKLFKILFEKNPQNAFRHTFDCGQTFFWRAAAEGNLDLVNFFLSHGAKNEYIDDERGITPLSIAVIEGHHAVVKAMIDAKVELDPIYSDPYDVIGVDDSDDTDDADDVDKQEYTKGPCPTDAWSIVEEGHKEYQLSEISKYKFSQQRITFDHIPPLLIAIENNDMQSVELLIKAGAVADDYQNYLFSAVKAGHLTFVKYLIEKIKDIKIDSLNDHGESALSLALKNDRYDVVRFLLQKNASIKNCDLEKIFLHSFFWKLELPYLTMSRDENHLPIIELKPTQDCLSQAQINNMMQMKLWCRYCYIKHDIEKRSAYDKRETPETAMIKDLIYRLDREQDKPLSQHLQEFKNAANYKFVTKTNAQLKNAQNAAQWNEEAGASVTTSQQMLFGSSKESESLNSINSKMFFEQLKKDAEKYAMPKPSVSSDVLLSLSMMT